mgnify:CR=1 FL=1
MGPFTKNIKARKKPEEGRNGVDLLPPRSNSTSSVIKSASPRRKPKPLVRDRDKGGPSIDLGIWQLNSKWARTPEDPTSHALKRNGKWVDPAMKNIERELEKLPDVRGPLSGSPEGADVPMNLSDFYNKPYSDRKSDLRDNPEINEAFAKGIFKTHGLKHWSSKNKVKKDPAYKKLSKGNQKKFSKIKDIIAKYESNYGKNLVGINK